MGKDTEDIDTFQCRYLKIRARCEGMNLLSEAAAHDIQKFQGSRMRYRPETADYDVFVLEEYLKLRVCRGFCDSQSAQE